MQAQAEISRWTTLLPQASDKLIPGSSCVRVSLGQTGIASNDEESHGHRSFEQNSEQPGGEA